MLFGDTTNQGVLTRGVRMKAVDADDRV